MCRRSEVCKSGRSKSNSSDTCSTKVVITEDSDVWRSNMLACVFGVIPSIPQQSADRQEWRVRGLWRDGKAVIWILAQAGTRRWQKKEEHLIYLSFSPPKQSWNARRGERRQKSEDRCLWCDNCRGRSRLTFLPNVWVLPILNRLLHMLTRAHPAVCMDHGGIFSKLQIKLPYQKLSHAALPQQSSWSDH